MLIPNPKIKLKIIHEEETFLVIDKPPFLPVYPLKPSETETVANGLVAAYPSQVKIGSPLEAGFVHRLDNDTSGLLVAARTRDMYQKLRALWNTDAVTKEYTALVLGKTPAQGKITSPIAHHPSKKKKMTVSPMGRPAETQFKKIKTVIIGGKTCSLLTVKIKTGVRHQIRVHLASQGFPILGDKLYGEKLSPLSRQFLHLSRILFLKKTFVSPLPDDLKV